MYGHKMEDYYNMRTGLSRTAEAIKKGCLTIGFLGGSITEGRANRWSDKLVDMIQAANPELIINVENAAIGATGSIHMNCRAERDILSRGCDLIIMEYAVNDGGRESHIRMCSREGLLRKLIRHTDADVVLTHTFMASFYDDIREGREPATIAEYEEIAEHYGISSVMMHEYAIDCVRKGAMTWEEWLPDGLHASWLGSRAYAEAVYALIMDSLDKPSRPHELPEPICPDNWENSYALDLKKIERRGAWRLEREHRYSMAEYNLRTSAPEAGLAYEFDGTGTYLVIVFGLLTSDFKWRIDGGEWHEEIIENGWVKTDESAWQRVFELTSGEKKGHHRVEIETIKSVKERPKGCRFDLLYVGILVD